MPARGTIPRREPAPGWAGRSAPGSCRHLRVRSRSNRATQGGQSDPEAASRPGCPAAAAGSRSPARGGALWARAFAGSSACLLPPVDGRAAGAEPGARAERRSEADGRGLRAAASGGAGRPEPTGAWQADGSASPPGHVLHRSKAEGESNPEACASAIGFSAGVEPATSEFRAQCSIQLSYEMTHHAGSMLVRNTPPRSCVERSAPPASAAISAVVSTEGQKSEVRGRASGVSWNRRHPRPASAVAPQWPLWLCGEVVRACVSLCAHGQRARRWAV
jgi:hypothetical protein